LRGHPGDARGVGGLAVDGFCPARAARHDEFAAIVGSEAVEHIQERRLLIRAQRLLAGGDEDLRRGPRILRPVEGRLVQIRDVDPLHRHLLMRKIVSGVRRPGLRGVDDVTSRELLASRGRENESMSPIETVLPGA
jgi:hypothetical protein